MMQTFLNQAPLLEIFAFSILAVIIHYRLSTESCAAMPFIGDCATAVFFAYIAYSICLDSGYGEGTKTAIVGISAYMSPYLSSGLARLGKQFEKDPISFLKRLTKNKSTKDDRTNTE
jgi:hypothetical protein